MSQNATKQAEQHFRDGIPFARNARRDYPVRTQIAHSIIQKQLTPHNVGKNSPEIP